MKKQTWISKARHLLTLLLLLAASQGYSQNGYNCSIDNINYPAPNMLEFDVMLSNTGTSQLGLQTFQMGLEFNYTAMANGGSITQSWVVGSSTGLLPAGFQDLSAQGAQTMGAALAGSGYRQIRLTAKTGVATASAVLLTSTPQKYCTMRLTHSTAFPAGVTPNFIWSFVNSSGRTRSAFSAFVNGSGTGTPLTSQTSGGFPNAVVANQGAAYSYTPGPQHFVNGNPAPPVGCATATLGTVTDPLCFGGTGSAVIDLSTSTDGTYVVDGGAAQSFTGVSSFTVSGLSQGAHTIDVTPQGCSTPTTFNVTIGGPSANGTNTTSATACDTYTWSVNGQTYTTSGTYTGTSTDANGCTVDETLNLTINASTSNTTSATACDTYTWSVDGMTYTTSGTYTSTSTNQAGCPHVETLNLTINASTSNTTSATACDTYTWSVDGMTYTTSGTYTSTSTNQAGCPHVETLNLTINASTSNTSSATACDTYTWSVDGMTYTTSGTYSYTTPPSGTTAHCAAAAATATCDEHIANVTIGSINNSSACSGGYADYTSISTAVTAGSSYTIDVTNGLHYNGDQCWAWADWNQDGDFTDAGEEFAFTYGNPITNGTITVPAGATNGNVKLRVRMNYVGAMSSCGTTSFGEVEDYTLVVSGGVAPTLCPHTETLNLTINASTSNSTSVTVCDTYTWSVDGMTYTTSGTYTSTSTNSAGCTHTEILNLSIIPSTTNTTNATACDTYTWSVDGMTYTTSGTYTYTTSGTTAPSYCAAGSTTNGCVSGDEYISNVTYGTVNNTSACTAGNYEDYTSLSSAVTAGSSFTIDVTNANNFSGDQVSVWADWNQDGDFTDAGEEYALTYGNPVTNGTIAVPMSATNGNVRMRVRLNYTGTMSSCGTTSFGEVEDYTLVVSGGTTVVTCPHTEILNLTINNSTSNSTSATACDTYTWSVDGMTYTTSGTYTYTTTNQAGCPHVETLNLTINASTSNTSSATACDSYTWACDGMTYTTSGTYTCTSTNAAGCPHVETLNLTINASTSNTTSATACDTYTWSVDGMTYTTSGTYTSTSTNTAGCPHVETLNLTINASTSNTTSATACDTYTWSVDGMTYTTSGTYTYTTTNQAGCAHVETLNLTINASTSNTTSATACDTYTWSVDGNTYTASGTYTSTSTNSAGCPHVETLNLTINASTSNTTSATACDTYTWSVDGMTYTTSGTYTSTSTNQAGCPHVETLNLTINASTSNTTSTTASGSYTWACNGMTYTASGTYTCTSTNSAGCPHVETLILTITAGCLNTTTVSACGSYTWTCNGMTYTTSGNYTCGTECLDLTVNPVPVVTAPNVGSCGGSVVLGGSPAGGTWNLPNPYSGNATTYTYFYTNQFGCTGSATGNITSQSATVTNLQVSNITGLTALVTWSGTAPWYEVRHKVIGAGSWIATTTTAAPNKLLTGLTPSTTYTVEVRGFCTTSTPGSWVGTIFTTNTGCGVPTGLTVTNITATTSKLNWTAVAGATYYTVRHRKVGNLTWITGTSATNSKNIAGLAANTNYEFQVAANCGTSTMTAFSGSTTWTTATSRGAEATTAVAAADLNIYPNPTTDEVTVELTATTNTLVDVKVVDMSGRTVKQIQSNIFEGVNNISLSLGDLANGIYTIQVVDNGVVSHVSRVTKN